MKKLLCVFLTLIMALSFAACTNEKEEGTYYIGLCNYVDDASLNQIVDNIQNQLKALGDEKGVTFKVYYENCQADANVLTQIIANFQSKDVDLMVGVATPVAIAMQAATDGTDLPVIFSAVSDPVNSGLVENAQAPEANITGTSDFLNTNAILDCALAVNPDAKKVGLLYDIGQDSSTTPIKDAKAYLDAKGIAYVERTGTTVDEVVLAAQALVNEQVDFVFTPTDNTVMKAELSLYEILANAGIPHYAGADSFALNGAFLGYGVNYANLGKETANMIFDVLVNGKAVKDVPVMTFDNGIATVNTEIAEKLGLSFDTLKTTLAPYSTNVNPIKTAEDFE